ncbi:MAG: hypothetical protein ACLP19_10785 [Xanthobacteraceae bacterium]
MAKLKRVIHARLPAFLGLRACNRRPAQSDGNDQNDSLFHRHISPQ